VLLCWIKIGMKQLVLELFEGSVKIINRSANRMNIENTENTEREEFKIKKLNKNNY